MTPRLVVSKPELLQEPCPKREQHNFTMCTVCESGGTVLASAVVLGSDDFEMTVQCPCRYHEDAFYRPHKCDCRLGRVPASVGGYETVTLVALCTATRHERVGETSLSRLLSGGGDLLCDIGCTDGFVPLAVAGVVHLIPRDLVIRAVGREAYNQVAVLGDALDPRMAVAPDHYDSLRGSGPVAYLTDIKETT